jgi:hypothetical protein
MGCTDHARPTCPLVSSQVGPCYSTIDPGNDPPSQGCQPQPNRRDVKLRVAGCFSTRWSSAGGWMYSRALSSTIGRTGTACGVTTLCCLVADLDSCGAAKQDGTGRKLWQWCDIRLGSHLQGGDQRGNASISTTRSTRKGCCAAQVVEQICFLLIRLLLATSQREVRHITCNTSLTVCKQKRQDLLCNLSCFL